MTWWSAVLLVGLTLRLLRLVQVDRAGKPLQKLIFKLWPGTVEQADYFIGCPFCIGFWISAATSTSWMLWGHTRIWTAGALPFAVSWLVGHVAARIDSEPS